MPLSVPSLASRQKNKTQAIFGFTLWIRAPRNTMYSYIFMIYREEWPAASVLSCWVSTGRKKSDAVWPRGQISNNNKYRVVMPSLACDILQPPLYSCNSIEY